MSDDQQRSPWICHICDFKSASTESRVCAVCYRVACPAHLQRVTLRNSESGLYEPADVCSACALH